ncbi:MAG: twin-arginine translocase TatA/TatE family subunit [Verrucomicrobia bacterium]|nr:twin-arginine translocase TatA/TatE family subunit [Verrucomicrobiota bacterium]
MYPLVPLAWGLPGGPEWFFLIALVLLFFGAKKLPELARGLGQSLGEFRKAKEEFDKELHNSANAVTSAPAKVETKPAEGTEPQQKS